MAAKVRRWLHPSKRVMVVVVMAAVVVAGGVGWALGGSSAPQYRTAPVEVASVTQTLNSVGTVSPANKASAAFTVSGTVAAVDATLGQRVKAGQVLARMDPSRLQQQVDSATTVIANTQQTLATDSGSQVAVAGDTTTVIGNSAVSAASFANVPLTVATASGLGPGSSFGSQGGAASSTGSTRTTGSGGQGGAGSSNSAGTAALVAKVTAAQQRVVALQKQIDAELTALKSELATENSDCTVAATSPVVSSGGSVGAAVVPVSGAVRMPASSLNAACQVDLTTVLQDEQKIADDQSTQQMNETDLNNSVTALTAAVQKAGSGSSPGGKSSSGVATGQSGNGSTAPAKGHGSSTAGSGQQANSGPSTGRSAGSNLSSGGTAASGSAAGSHSSQPASAAQLVADQSAIDAAQANLVLANQNLGAAVLTSPITGIVGQVAITAGSNVSASSQNTTIVIVGSGAELVNTTVPLSAIDQLKVGDQVTADVDGVAQPQLGKVSLIGVLNSGTGTSTTYPVTIQLDAGGPKLLDGVNAEVAITLRMATNVLTVPTSAVHILGPLQTVTVLAAGKTSTARVQIGATGADRTQITSGLTAGQLVVLADLKAPLPSNSTNTRGLGGVTTGGGLTGGGVTRGGSAGGRGRSGG